MFYRLAADLVVLVHFGFILFVVLGAWLTWRRPKLAWLHVPAFIWGVMIEFKGWICPLTPLENYLRQLGGGGGYRGDFIEHYLLPVIYPEGLIQEIRFVLATIVLAINLPVYGYLLYRGTGNGDS